VPRTRNTAIRILKKGTTAWNPWRTTRRGVSPQFRNVDLRGLDLRSANLVRVDFSGANLEGTDFRGANLRDAILTNANLSYTNLRFATLIRANLSEASLVNSYLSGANLYGANLDYSDFTDAKLEGTNFGSNDLSLVKGLETVVHFGPSAIGIDTLYKSAGNIPERFLVNCGVPDNLITYLPSLIGTQQSIQFYSIFISYNREDEEFAKRLHSRLRDEHLRVWFAPEDIKAGEKLHEQIDRAIQIHDRLLIVLSENSLKSEWVMSEIRKARTVEILEKRQKMFPIRLVSYETVRAWTCFDTDTGKDLAVEVREYFIPDFSNWRNHDDFEKAFARLLKDLETAKRT